MNDIEASTIAPIAKDIYEIRGEIAAIKEKSLELSAQKREIELELNKLSSRVRNRTTSRMPPDEYKGICRRQIRCKEILLDIEKKLSVLKLERQKWADIETELYIKSGLRGGAAKSPQMEENESILKVTAIRNKYLAFSEDPTRVNSMRLMAAQFAKELTEVLAGQWP